MLDAGTNSGKTYFILKTLLPWAYEHRKRILILCNREALRNQIERDVNRLGSIEVSYEDYDPALGGIVNKPAIDNKYEHTMACLLKWMMPLEQVKLYMNYIQTMS